MEEESEIAFHSHETKMRGVPGDVWVLPVSPRKEQGAIYSDRSLPGALGPCGAVRSRGEWTRALQGLRPELPRTGSEGGTGVGPPGGAFPPSAEPRLRPEEGLPAPPSPLSPC